MKLKYNDKVHGYWLDGRRCKGISTAAKVPDDTFQLDNWRKRQVLRGVAINPKIAAAAAAHHDDKDKLDELAEQALLLAGSSDGAMVGTAAHRIIERHLLGEEIMRNEQSTTIIGNFEDAMSRVGLKPLPEYVEQVVLYPEQYLAGRFDQMAERQSDGMLCVCDVKTGTRAIRYPHSTCVQLAGYANAPRHAHMPPGRNGETEKFTLPPENLDTEVGYVIHVTDLGTDIYSVNLKLGWKCLEQIVFPTYRWRAVPNEKLIKKVS